MPAHEGRGENSKSMAFTLNRSKNYLQKISLQLDISPICS